MALILHRAQGHRSGDCGPDDYDVLDGERVVGRIFLQPHGAWFWGLGFKVQGRKHYGDAKTREAAMAAFKAEYERWLIEVAN